MNNSLDIKSNTNVWRYMDFSKFVWLLQNEALWLSRSDLLGDPWEISLSGEQLQLVINRHPITPLNEPPRETAMERAERIVNNWRKSTFVNCWNMSAHESYALWRIYCKTSAGVLIQTSYEKLNVIKNEYSICPVEYIIPGSTKKTPTHIDLVTKKRPMFSYEEEIRIFYHDEKRENTNSNGIKLKFDISKYIESIRVHPQADDVFYETVQTIIKKYIPNFEGDVVWSDMRLSPPF